MGRDGGDGAPAVAVISSSVSAHHRRKSDGGTEPVTLFPTAAVALTCATERVSPGMPLKAPPQECLSQDCQIDEDLK